MFCSQCGTQVDQGKNFCKNCGARVGGSAQPGEAAQQTVAFPVEPAAAPSRTQATPVPPAREKSGINNKLIIVAAGIVVLLLGAAGVYFGSDRSKPPAVQTPSNVAQPAAKSAEAPPLPSFEETKDAAPAGDVASANPSSPPEPGPPAQVESPKPPSELLSQPERRTDVPPPPSKSQFKRAGEEPPPAGRSSRPRPAAASRGANPGIYETLRTTTVYEDPSASSKVIASIAAGTRVNVVSSNGDWLEVHSKRGNPPGFIRRGDASFVEGSNRSVR